MSHMRTQTTAQGAPPARRSRKSTRTTPAEKKSQPAGASQTVHVDLGARSYDIVVERGLLSHVGPKIAAALGLKGGAGGRTAAVVVNPKVEHYYGKTIYASL